MEEKVPAEKHFVPAVLPWLVAAAGLIVYLLTLNHWVSLNGLTTTARASGWVWTPEVFGPFYFLVTYPFRWLPAAWVSLALNLFSTACAVLTLALLARSVALLPHDRTHEQRQREPSAFSRLSTGSAWIPPVLAGLVLGLQLTFWENATAASNEIFDLLLFAYIVRCLLEYRIDERESWLTRAALVYGAAITGDWAMIAFLPAFLAALIWILRLRFFNLGFLTRMFLCALAGLLLYLLLPLAQVFSTASPISFWDALHSNLATQKWWLERIPFNRYVLFLADNPLWVLGLTSLLPVLLIGIRWPSYFGDTSKLGITLATWIFHLMHGILLAVCVWVAFDPQFSPRHKGLPFSFLTLYYLGALSVGYLSGYFLLVFRPIPDRFQRPPPWQKLIHRTAGAVVGLLLVLVPAGLIYKNLPQIRLTNGPTTQRYAALLAQGLPDHAVVLSDDVGKLYLVGTLLEQAGKATNYLFLDTAWLRWPQYHLFLKQIYDGRWPVQIDAKKIKRGIMFDDMAMRGLMVRLSRQNLLYYLHPSFGYYFEDFYLQPHGAVYEMKLYPTNSLDAPPLTEAETTANERFWEKANDDFLGPLQKAITPPAPDQAPGFRGRFMQKLHVPFETNATAATIAALVSRDLTYLGVELQRAGKLPEAAGCFARAQALKPDNIAAEKDLELNNSLRSGRRHPANLIQSVEDQFGHRDWQQIMNENGPFDEPSFCFREGQLFLAGHLLRQAAQEFERVRTLDPDNFPVRLWLARIYMLNRMPNEVLSLIRELRAHPDELKAAHVSEWDLLQLEAAAHFANNDPQPAEQLLQSAMDKNPTDDTLLARVVQVCTLYGRYSNALATVEKELQLKPDDPNALFSKGYLCLQTGEYEQAISPFTRVLAIQTNNYPALLNRAIACLRTDKLDDAQRDYEALQKVFTNYFPIYYGLGEIAYRKKDTNAAIYFYQLYLANSNSIPNSTPGAEEVKFVSDRLKGLQTDSP